MEDGPPTLRCGAASLARRRVARAGRLGRQGCLARLWIMLGAGVACWPGITFGQTPAAAFDAANRLYEEGHYAEAAGAYEKLAREGVNSAAVYFNLGNACFKSSQLGRAIVAYRQAERLTPRDPDVRANLQFARNQVQGLTLWPTRWQRWLGRLSLNEWTLLAAAGLWLLFLLLALLQWRPALKASLRGYIVMVAVAAVLLCAGLAAAGYQTRLVRLAIVVRPEAIVRLTPLDEGKEAFTVHDGAELRVLEQDGKWLLVSAGQLRRGWLERGGALLVP